VIGINSLPAVGAQRLIAWSTTVLPGSNGGPAYIIASGTDITERNLVCPSSYDLGENLRLVLLSVTEGEDKPLKYPTIFNSADVAVITKMDLAAAVEFDEAAARANIQAVRPGMLVFTVSSKSGTGMEEFFNFLAGRSTELRMATPA
jgi:CobW/HypB/UreG, nucleotide-binding domain